LAVRIGLKLVSNGGVLLLRHCRHSQGKEKPKKKGGGAAKSGVRRRKMKRQPGRVRLGGGGANQVKADCFGTTNNVSPGKKAT